jgi:hypothetical protein
MTVRRFGRAPEVVLGLALGQPLVTHVRVATPSADGPCPRSVRDPEAAGSCSEGELGEGVFARADHEPVEVLGHEPGVGRL